MKVGVVGVGAVGSACTMALLLRASAREIVLVDKVPARAAGVATDMRYGAALVPGVDVRDGEYSDLAGAAVIMITAGINEKAGGATDRSDPSGRLKLLDVNAGVYRDVVPRLVAAAPDAMLLVVTDPPDPLADLTRRLAGHNRVLSTGTFLDSLRFRAELARRLGVRPGSVEADVVGEHGTSEVFLWSSARVGGVPVLEALMGGATAVDDLRAAVERDVRYANITIIEGTGASQHGIGMVSTRITEMVLRNEQTVIPIGSYHATYGVTLSLPSAVGREGVSRVFEPPMSDEDRQALQRCVDTLKQAGARVAG